MAIAEIIEEADVILIEKTEEVAESFSIKEFDSFVSEPESPVSLILPNDQNLKEAFTAFAIQQSPSAAALIRMFEPKLEGNEVKVSMHKANMNLTEPIKIEWQAFLRNYFKLNNLVLSLIEDNTVIQQTKAYTPREQLDELTKEHPLVKELVKKLNLKLK